MTDWRLYDTAYTERYLGLPKENSDGYDKSSVLSYVEGIPDEPNRLLIFHGMIGMCFMNSRISFFTGQSISLIGKVPIEILPGKRHIT